jgi:hypothetical protein
MTTSMRIDMQQTRVVCEELRRVLNIQDFESR